MTRRRKVALFCATATALVLFFIFRSSNRTQIRPAPTNKVVDDLSSRLSKEVRAKEKPTNLRVLLIGWDAADWQIADPLMKAGRMPNLTKLARSGSRAFLHSFSPMLSPLIWNSIATGKYPTEHGILDFLVTDPQTKKPAPINSTFRKCMALWNILTEAGRRTAFVAWWATWPAERVKGVIVSDRVSYSLFSSLSSSGKVNGLTSPQNYYDQIKTKLLSEQDISDQELARFINLTPDEIHGERQQTPSVGKTNPIKYLAQVLASTRNYYNISLDLLSKNQFDLFSCYFEGIDQVGHLFQHYMAPKMDLATEEEFRRYKDVVPRFYEYMDELTGELNRLCSKNTVVILVSDHGFKNGAGRPVDFAPYLNERPAYWHREYGMFLLSGAPARKNIRIDTVRVFDVAPTILYLLGLPVGKDLPGKVLTDALDSQFVTRFPVQTIPSWEPFRHSTLLAQSNAAIDSEAMENLSALGYIGKSGQRNETAIVGKETAAFHRNLAIIYLNEKKFDAAKLEIRKSMELGSNFESYDLLFQTRRKEGQLQQAAETLQEGLNHFTNAPPEAYINLIDSYIQLGRIADAKTAAAKYEPVLPSSKYRMQIEGMIAEAEKKLPEAELKYRNALREDPSFSYAFDRLYTIYKARGELEKLEEPARDALRRNDQIALCYNVLGVVLKKQGRYREAIDEYNKAIDLDPDNSTYLANLGAAYLSMKLPDEALEVLLRAKERAEKDPEVWINLGAVYGTLQKNKEGIAAFEQAKELAGDSPNVELGIAAIYAQMGKRQEAIAVAQQALARYPDNADLRELLTMLQ